MPGRYCIDHSFTFSHLSESKCLETDITDMIKIMNSKKLCIRKLTGSVAQVDWQSLKFVLLTKFILQYREERSFLDRLISKRFVKINSIGIRHLFIRFFLNSSKMVYSVALYDQLLTLGSKSGFRRFNTGVWHFTTLQTLASSREHRN